MKQNWLTNDPDAVKALRAIDKEYAKAVDAAKLLSLDGKIKAMRAARDKLNNDYLHVLPKKQP